LKICNLKPLNLKLSNKKINAAILNLKLSQKLSPQQIQMKLIQLPTQAFEQRLLKK
jgi:hypothetical protein